MGEFDKSDDLERPYCGLEREHDAHKDCTGWGFESGEPTNQAERRQKAQIAALNSAIEWACGSAPDPNGNWFGQDLPAKHPPFWWRAHLMALQRGANLIAGGETK